MGLLQATPNAAGGDEVQRQPLISKVDGPLGPSGSPRPSPAGEVDTWARRAATFRATHEPAMLKTMPNPFGALAICLGIGTAGGPVTQAQAPSHTAAQAIVEGTCQDCHNDRARYGNMSLAGFEVIRAYENRALRHCSTSTGGCMSRTPRASTSGPTRSASPPVRTGCRPSSSASSRAHRRILFHLTNGHCRAPASPMRMASPVCPICAISQSGVRSTQRVCRTHPAERGSSRADHWPGVIQTRWNLWFS